LIQTYNVPKPVLRQITSDLAPWVSIHPAQTLVLCDALWNEPFLECRTLAASLLGMTPPQPPHAIIALVSAWVGQGVEDRLLETIVQSGLVRLRQEMPDSYFQAVEGWLSAEEQAKQLLGLIAMQAVAASRDFDNFPAYFHALTPLMRASPSRFHRLILDVLRAFAQRSPKETAYFLRQNFDTAGSPGAAWLARQLLPHLPPETRNSLRAALREL